MVIKYENGKIYKIIGPIANEPCYVGSTTKPYLSQRMAKHIDNYKRWKKGKSDQSKLMSYELFDKYGPNNCRIILLEAVEAKSKDELRIKEQEYIDKIECVNKKRAYSSLEQHKQNKRLYRQENKTFLQQVDRNYRERNKEVIREAKRNYYLKNKDTIITKHDKYREINRERIQAQKKKYCINNIEKIKLHAKKKYTCTC